MKNLKTSEQFRQFIQSLTSFLFADHNIESVEKAPDALSITLYDGTKFFIKLVETAGALPAGSLPKPAGVNEALVETSPETDSSSGSDSVVQQFQPKASQRRKQSKSEAAQ